MTMSKLHKVHIAASLMFVGIVSVAPTLLPATPSAPGQAVSDAEAATLRGGASNCRNRKLSFCDKNNPNPDNPDKPCSAVGYYGVNEQDGTPLDPQVRVYCGLRAGCTGVWGGPNAPGICADK